MNSKILIIGAGQLGSRHLQGLALLETPSTIYVVDPSMNSLEIARSRFEEVSGFEKHQCSFFTSLDEVVASEVDVSIVATNSTIRASIIHELLLKLRTRYVVLEKFLFPRSSEYKEIDNLLNSNSVIGYVNCPRRMFKTYIDIKKQLIKGEPIRMEVIGNEWGLACNSVHFIDLFSFLSNSIVDKWEPSLAEGFIESKRKGYVEFIGSIESKLDDKNHISITCFQGGRVNTSVRISTPSIRFVIHETLGKVITEKIEEDNLSISEHPFEMAYQSGLTNVVVEELLISGECSLTPYNLSKEMHIPLLETLLEHYNRDLEVKTELCPIT